VTDTEVVDNLEHACWGQYIYVYIYIYIYTKNHNKFAYVVVERENVQYVQRSL